ncbi:MAG: hypothetical protein V7749_05185 [Cocleimonas sp.]
MIESRYKIEYVLPDEDAKKTSSFRVLWYLLLIPLILLAVTAITYDFSLKNISKDSLLLVEKAKIHIFNLEDRQQTERFKKPVNVVVKTPAKPLTTIKTAKKLIETPVINKDKIVITELTSKQKLQLKTIQTQIAENSELTANLEKLSEQFMLEQVKNQALNSRLAEQEKDRIELEEQLNKILEDSADKEIVKEAVTFKENKKDFIIIEEKTKESLKLIPTKTVEVDVAQEVPEEIAKEITQEVTQEVIIEDQSEQSATDKIVAAMANIASDKKKKAAVEEKTVIEDSTLETGTTTEVDVKVENEGIALVKESINNEKEAASSKVLVENIDPPKVSEPTLVTLEIKPVETVEDQVEKVVEIETTEVKTEVTIDIAKEESEEKVVTNTPAASGNSAVDDIIAAMQESQSNVTSSNASDTSK